MPWQQETSRQRSSVKIMPPINFLTDAHFLVSPAKWPPLPRELTLVGCAEHWEALSACGNWLLWLFHNKALISRGTQMTSPREKLSKTNISAEELLLCAQNDQKGVTLVERKTANSASRGFCVLTGHCCLCAALRNLRERSAG